MTAMSTSAPGPGTAGAGDGAAGSGTGAGAVAAAGTFRPSVAADAGAPEPLAVGSITMSSSPSAPGNTCTGPRGGGAAFGAASAAAAEAFAAAFVVAFTTGADFGAAVMPDSVVPAFAAGPVPAAGPFGGPSCGLGRLH